MYCSRRVARPRPSLLRGERWRCSRRRWGRGIRAWLPRRATSPTSFARRRITPAPGAITSTRSPSTKRPTDPVTPKSPWIWKIWPDCCRRWAGRRRRAVFSNGRKPSRPRNRTQRLPCPVYSDPVIGESQVGLRLDNRHVARHAGAPSDRRAVLGRRVAARAALVIIGRHTAQRRMGRVTGEAGQSAPALAEAVALAEIDRLMPRAPGIVPIGVLRGRGRPAMTASAELVQPGRGETLRIVDRAARPARLDVSGPRAVARFAAYPELGGLYFFTRAHRQRSRGVALEAAQDIGGRIGEA